VWLAAHSLVFGRACRVKTFTTTGPCVMPQVDSTSHVVSGNTASLLIVRTVCG